MPSLCVGIPCKPDVAYCGNCGYDAGYITNEWGYKAERFRPLDTLTETMERIEKEGCPLELEHA